MALDCVILHAICVIVRKQQLRCGLFPTKMVPLHHRALHCEHLPNIGVNSTSSTSRCGHSVIVQLQFFEQ